MVLRVPVLDLACRNCLDSKPFLRYRNTNSFSEKAVHGPVSGPCRARFGFLEGETRSMRTAVKCLVLLAVLLLPASVFAQATLTGTVKDDSGAVLPGVT